MTILNDSPKVSMYGAVHGPKYGVAMTDCVLSDDSYNSLGLIDLIPVHLLPKLRPAVIRAMDILFGRFFVTLATRSTVKGHKASVTVLGFSSNWPTRPSLLRIMPTVYVTFPVPQNSPYPQTQPGISYPNCNIMIKPEVSCHENVVGLKSVDCETPLAALDLFTLEYRWLRGDLLLTYALFEQGSSNRFLTVDPASTLWGHGKKIFKLSAHTYIRQQFFPIRVIAAWSNLPSTVVKAHSGAQSKALLDTFMRVHAPTTILSHIENLKSSATPFFHLCLSGERQPLNDKNKNDRGNLGKSLDPCIIR
ncbi:hypothetical protein CLF_107235 [Clonorchis sinensis]|uniref:Uncharacterized protein n=1 Tax=Clonorchis sinensis TaxID=79923 RepID=H2KRV4_CLOSI|nr:hypothetical protein CLF_107235 [Clonorchis sinensis]